MKKISQKKGFGLLEVLLAGVIIIIIMGALVIVARAAIQNSIYLQQRSQATFLSQQAMEVVRQIRDSNYIDTKSESKWNTLGYKRNPNKWEPVDIGRIYQAKYEDIGTSDYRWYLEKTSSPTEVNIDNTNFKTKIEFAMQTSGSNQILSNPSILSTWPSSEQLYYFCTVTTTWTGFNGKSSSVEIKELLANSRQGF